MAERRVVEKFGRVLLEVCIGSVDDAVVAEDAGADRLELNEALGLGGLTPSLGLLIETKSAVKLPVIAMIRPRPGGFAYSPADFRVMIRDAQLLTSHGADGLAFGILNEAGRIDKERCLRLMEAIPPGVETVFHRAFDVSPDPFESLETLIELGFSRVLTSGQQSSAPLGADLIAALVERAQGRIEILPGGGINAGTVDALLARTGCRQVHGSLRSILRDPSASHRPEIRFSSEKNPPEDCFEATDPVRVRDLRRRLSLQNPTFS